MNTVLLVRRNKKILTLLYRDNRLMRAEVCDETESVLDNIYLGRVKKVVPNIGAAFVEFLPGKLCFLPLKDCREPILANRLYEGTFQGELKAEDEIAVQIVRDASGTKEYGATADLSFAGKYLVLTTGKRQTGFSAKLSKEQKALIRVLISEEEPFRDILKRYGLVVRTNVISLLQNDCEPCSEYADTGMQGSVESLARVKEILLREVTFLAEQADNLKRNAPHRTCYSILKKSETPYLKSLQNYYEWEYDRIETDDDKIFHELKQYLTENHLEAMLKKLVFYQDEMLPLSNLYSVETRLSEALDRKVWMKSGAYLVIDRAEALTCIDVNSGKCVDKKNPQEHYERINLEAAEEIAHQLMLRNLSGIIIIDFINMKSEEANRRVMQRLRTVLSRDPVKTDVIDMTPLGLVEVTRKKGKKPLYEQLAEQ